MKTLQTWLSSAWAAPARWRALDELSRLNDAQLRDIGVERDQLPTLFHTGAVPVDADHVARDGGAAKPAFI